ncbi:MULTISPECIES: helix-turn-helix transcriptional regulator [unclassified Nocardia]|nr:MULTISPECIES: helix-turn-helix transcriptional regulator [unclassified Nocardia]
MLREMRERAGKSLLTAGLEIDVSPPTVLRLEQGLASKVSGPQIEKLLDLYRLSPRERAGAMELWKEVREQAKVAKLQGTSKAFWQAYADQLAAHFPHYLRLEAAASSVTTHQLVLMPGLLQTPDYRRAMGRMDNPELSTVDAERRVELMIRRQTRLGSTGFRLRAFISEATLRHQIGGPSVMAEQLRWLVAAGEIPGLIVRIIPFGPAYRALTIGSFTLLEFPTLERGLREPPVVYIEDAFGALYHEQEAVVTKYREAVESLHAVALSEEDTRDMVLRVAKEYAA